MDKDLEICLRNIVWLREHHGISKRRMCRLLHIGVATWDAIERGELPPLLGIEMAFYIAEECHVSPADLFRRRLWES